MLESMWVKEDLSMHLVLGVLSALSTSLRLTGQLGLLKQED